MQERTLPFLCRREPSARVLRFIVPPSVRFLLRIKQSPAHRLAWMGPKKRGPLPRVLLGQKLYSSGLGA